MHICNYILFYLQLHYSLFVQPHCNILMSNYHTGYMICDMFVCVYVQGLHIQPNIIICPQYILALFPACWLITLWAKAEDMACCVSFTLQCHQSALQPLAQLQHAQHPPLFHQQPVSAEESEKQRQQEIAQKKTRAASN